MLFCAVWAGVAGSSIELTWESGAVAVGLLLAEDG